MSNENVLNGNASQILIKNFIMFRETYWCVQISSSKSNTILDQLTIAREILKIKAAQRLFIVGKHIGLNSF